MIKRKQTIVDALAPKRALVVYGPRRVGKTTMLQKYLQTRDASSVLSVVGDDMRVRELFGSQMRDRILAFAQGTDVIAIDEAQQVPFIGLGIKMITDTLPEKTVILTGSSSFELSSEIGEPLVGRHYALTLYPVAYSEINVPLFEKEGMIDDLLVFGSYPEVLSARTREEKIRILNELVSSYLYRDVLALERIKSPDLLRDIARLIAFQVGSEISLNEIARRLQTDAKTVGRYLDLLEKMFIIKRIRTYSTNARNEISTKAKYYFLDNGVRNAVIGQYNELSLRNDVGALWKNFVFMELVKKNNLAGVFAQYYFWRTTTGTEVDIVIEKNGKLYAYECKYAKDAKPPKLFKEMYPESEFSVCNKETISSILLSDTH